jgi:hypothetical protein
MRPPMSGRQPATPLQSKTIAYLLLQRAKHTFRTPYGLMPFIVGRELARAPESARKRAAYRQTL